MKTMIYAGLLAAAATIFTSCKQDKTNIEDEISIFKVEAKPAIETSAEDAAWEINKYKQPVISSSFINKHIINYGEFIADIFTPIGSQNEYHTTQKLTRNQYLAFKINEMTIWFNIKQHQLEFISKPEPNIDNASSRAFNKIATQNNDVNYNGYYWEDRFGYSYIPTEYVNIECVQNYDVAHPAGTLLNDIATIDYRSAETFIRSGYKNIRMEENSHPSRTSLLPEPLVEFNTKRVNMIEDLLFVVRLTQAPDVEGVYTFKLTYKDISGEVRTATTTPIRLAAKG